MRLAPAPRKTLPGPRASAPAPAITAPVRANPAPHRTGAPPRGPAREVGPGNGHHKGRHAGLDRGDRARRNGDGGLVLDQEPDLDGGSRSGAGHGEQPLIHADGRLTEQVSTVVQAEAGDRGQNGLEGDDLRLLTLLAGGLPANAVARKMNLSPRTLRRRTRTLCDKIGVHTPIEAVAWAARRLLI